MNKDEELKLKRQKQAKDMRDAKEEKKDIIPVKKDFLETLQKEIEGLKKDRDLLLSVADKRALAMHYQRNQGDIPKVINLRVIDEKVIVGWRNIKDDVYDKGDNKWVEDQQTELLFEDGSSRKMRIKDFERLHTKVECKRLAVIKKEGGDIEFRLKRTDNGKEYLVNATFVN